MGPTKASERLACLISLVVALALPCVARAHPSYPVATSGVETKDFARDNAVIIASRVRPDEVFIGDSVTHGWRVIEPRFFSEGRIDRGISSETAHDVVERFDRDVVSLHPRVVHILIGANDLFRPKPDYGAVVSDVSSMIDMSSSHGIFVMIGSVLPMRWRAGKDDLPADRVPKLDAALSALAHKKGVTFVDYRPALDDGNGGQKRSLSFDGIHPNALGYAKMEPIHDMALFKLAQRKGPNTADWNHR